MAAGERHQQGGSGLRGRLRVWRFHEGETDRMGEVCNKMGHIQSRKGWSLESLEAKQLQWQSLSLPKGQRSLEATMEQQGELSE